MERLYAVRKLQASPTVTLWSQARTLEQELLSWAKDLPSYLQLNSQEELANATPHILALHMQWECAMIVLQLPL
jgi:hypothetical protein